MAFCDYTVMCVPSLKIPIKRIYKKIRTAKQARRIVKCDKRHHMVASITETINAEVAERDSLWFTFSKLSISR